jgi:hypothetical protein
MASFGLPACGLAFWGDNRTFPFVSCLRRRVLRSIPLCPLHSWVVYAYTLAAVFLIFDFWSYPVYYCGMKPESNSRRCISPSSSRRTGSILFQRRISALLHLALYTWQFSICISRRSSEYTACEPVGQIARKNNLPEESSSRVEKRDFNPNATTTYSNNKEATKSRSGLTSCSTGAARYQRISRVWRSEIKIQTM